LSMYAFLDLAVISALCLASDENGIRLKCAFVGLFAVFNLPNLSGQFWTSVVDTPTFFQRQAYQQSLRRGETVLILPYGENGNALLWQAQSGFFFNMAEGGAGVRMEEWRRWPIVGAFEKKTYVPQAAEQFKAFTAAHNVSTVVVLGNQVESWKRLLM